eukprot:10269569-Ditylum_brightwellii.AAC.1
MTVARRGAKKPAINKQRGKSLNKLLEEEVKASGTSIRQQWKNNVKEGKSRTNSPISPSVCHIVGTANRMCKGKDLERDYNNPSIDVIDDKASVQIKQKVLNSIIEWINNETNVSERGLSFLNKPDFVKFVLFDYDFRKAVHEKILTPILMGCLPSIGAGADMVSAVVNSMVPSYKIYKLHKDCNNKYIVGCPLGTRSCPYYRHIDVDYAHLIPQTLHDVVAKILGNKTRKEETVQQTRIYLRWDDHIEQYQTDAVKGLMHTKGKRNTKVLHLLQGMCDHWMLVHSELRTLLLLSEVEGYFKEKDKGIAQ